MDIQYFLFRRLSFIEQLYATSTALYVERIRKIEAKEEPFQEAYSECEEPAFLEEWMESNESLQHLGGFCLSMICTSLHLYFKTLVHHLGKPVPPSLNTTFKTRGWFQGYKTFFLEVHGVDFQNSPCNLGLFEELVLARNRVQHPEWISTYGSNYSPSDLKKLQSPFYVHEKEIAIWSEIEDGERRWIAEPSIDVTPKKLAATIKGVRDFSQWLEASVHQG